MRSFLSLKINCHGVSFDDLPTFLVPFIVLRWASKSFDTSIRVESFSGLSTMSLSPTALDPGGPFFRTSLTTLYHFLSNILSFSRSTASTAKTSRSHFDFLSAIFVRVTDAEAVFPFIEILVNLISGYPLKRVSISLRSFAVTSVFCHTGPVITTVV